MSTDFTTTPSKQEQAGNDNATANNHAPGCHIYINNSLKLTNFSVNS